MSTVVWGIVGLRLFLDRFAVPRCVESIRRSVCLTALHSLVVSTLLNYDCTGLHGCTVETVSLLDKLQTVRNASSPPVASHAIFVGTLRVADPVTFPTDARLWNSLPRTMQILRSTRCHKNSKHFSHIPLFCFSFSWSLQFLADRTNGRAYATVLRLSSVCDVMYCG